MRVGPEQLRAEERASIASISPSGFQAQTYAFIPGGTLYNRCHLIAHQLGGPDIEENLITGTRWLNEQMIRVENTVAEYVKKTGDSVDYTVKPVFRDGELVCRGVSFRAAGLAEGGLDYEGYIANVQPGVMIDYATGFAVEAPTETVLSATPAPPEEAKPTYILNTGTKRFHRPSCPSCDEMKPKNRQEYYGDRETLIDQGYKPCGRCHP